MGNSLPQQCTQDSLGKEEDSVHRFLLCAVIRPCACAHKSQHVLCGVSSSCREGTRCHEDELRQPTPTLGGVIPAGIGVLLTPVSSAVHLCYLVMPRD